MDKIKKSSPKPFYTNIQSNTRYYGRDISYEKGDCPQAEAIIDTAIKMPVNEFFTDEDAREIIAAFCKVSKHFASKA